VARKILWASLALAPLTFVADFLLHFGDVALFVLASIALIPLAWLIGEATDHAADHTGPGIGGFLNATFGNAPELIISLLAINNGLTEVVRGSLTGSVVGNLLLVLGFSLLFGRGDQSINRESSFMWLALILVATLAFLIPAVPGWHGDHERHALAVLSLPVAVVLLVLYVGATWWQLRRHRQQRREPPDSAAGVWSLTRSMWVLAVATVLTAFIAEILVESIETFSERAHLSDFFVAAVIVAIVGNAAEHGGAVIVAYRGKVELAVEIALSSGAQVAVFLIPAVALLSWPIEPLALSFRKVELGAVGFSALLIGLLFWDRRSSNWHGAALIGVYAGVAAAFFLAGDRG
jgi:Ca2+:H+ antiporter